MPIHECSIEDKPGYKWGESGKCYTYVSGNEKSRKEAKRKAYIQGYAMRELTEMEVNEWIPIETELATIVDVPIIHAGTFQPHNTTIPFEVSEEDLDEIVKGSTVLQPIIQEAIQTGNYRGNEDITKRLSKPIPGLINIKHQQPFASQELSEKFNAWLKDAVQGVTVSFEKKLIDGKNWVIKRFHNVRNDVAETLRQQYPFRSSEFLPLTDPKTGKHYAKVERSTAFLDILTPPAVGGQTPELVIEFMGTEDEPLTIITTTGVINMPKPGEKIETVDVSELQAMKETLATQEQALAELQAETAKAKEDREKAVELAKQQEAKNQKLAHTVSELQSKNYLQALERHREKDGNTYRVNPAYLEIVKPIIEGNGIIELADGQNQQEAMFKLFDEIAEIGNVTIQLSLEDEKSYAHSEKKPNKQAMIQELMEKEQLSENDAWIRVTDTLREYTTQEVH